MTVVHKVWPFPTFPISKQLFAASGQAFEAGMTVGGVRMQSPEPGGRSMLEIQPSLQVGEWDYPMSSWLMSKINGDIFRIRLAPTPQIASLRSGDGTPWRAGTIYPDSPWSNFQNWSGDLIAQYKTAALEGTNTVQINMSLLGRILQRGHVIGHRDNCYLVDDISYNDANVATLTVNPPFRKNVVVGDMVLFRPYFLGSISNGDEFRTTYDAENNGAIQVGRIRLSEVII
jgi:hypothetical protein